MLILLGIFIKKKKKIPSEKILPDSKPKPIPNLTLTRPLTPHGGFFPWDFFLTPFIPEFFNLPFFSVKMVN